MVAATPPLTPYAIGLLSFLESRWTSAVMFAMAYLRNALEFELKRRNQLFDLFARNVRARMQQHYFSRTSAPNSDRSYSSTLPSCALALKNVSTLPPALRKRVNAARV